MQYHDFKEFLSCETPATWVEAALENIPVLLVDHAHCEKKAASTAISLLYRYPENTELMHRMSRLAREELRHFEQVIDLMAKQGIYYQHLSPARYAGELRALIRPAEPDKLIDTLIVGAFIEARSAERFEKLIPKLSGEMKTFYSRLLTSEARHFMTYLEFAQKYSYESIEDRIASFAEKEALLISSADPDFRFHSGIPLPEKVTLPTA